MNKALPTHRPQHACAASASGSPAAHTAPTRFPWAGMLADNPLAALIFGDFAYLKKPV